MGSAARQTAHADESLHARHPPNQTPHGCSSPTLAQALKSPPPSRAGPRPVLVGFQPFSYLQSSLLPPVIFAFRFPMGHPRPPTND